MVLFLDGRGRIGNDALLGGRRIHWSLTGTKQLRSSGRRAQWCSEALCVCLEVVETDLPSAATRWRQVVITTQLNGLWCCNCLRFVVVGLGAAVGRRWLRLVVFLCYRWQKICQSWRRVVVLDLHGGKLCHCLIQR